MPVPMRMLHGFAGVVWSIGAMFLRGPASIVLLCTGLLTQGLPLHGAILLIAYVVALRIFGRWLHECAREDLRIAVRGS